MEGLDLGRNESHADIRAKKCNMGWKALSRLSCRASVSVRLRIGTAAVRAAVQNCETALQPLQRVSSSFFKGELNCFSVSRVWGVWAYYKTAIEFNFSTANQKPHVSNPQCRCVVCTASLRRQRREPEPQLVVKFTEQAFAEGRGGQVKLEDLLKAAGSASAQHRDPQRRSLVAQ